MNRIFLPLHPAQQDVFTDQLINVDSPQYNIGGYIKLKGVVSKEKFLDAIYSMPKVFDVFKMRFYLGADGPLCFVDKDFENLELTELDLSGHDDPQAEARDWMQKRFNTAFAIREENLLFEICVIKIAAGEYWFYGRFHHLLTDGYGFIVLVNYLALKYRSLVAGSELPFSYPSYLEEAAKAAAYINSPGYEADGKYWKDKIGEKPGKILPAKYPRSNAHLATSSTYVLNITPIQRRMLDELQLATRAGLQHLTIAALIIYFGKTTDQSEFVFGIPVHKRSSKKQKNIVGMFSGILPYKGYFKKNNKIIDLVQEITLSQRVDYRHQDYPIGDLSRDLKGKTGDGYLHEISINYEPLNFELDFGEEVEAGVVRLANDHERYPLQICWRDYSNNQPLQLHIHFGNEFFSREEIGLFTDRMLFIIEQFPANLDNVIECIDILPQQEKSLLMMFNQTAADFPLDKNMVMLFEEQAAKTPDNIALVFEERQLSYRELNDLSNQLGHYLKIKGVKAETLVPLCIKRSIEMIVGILGILKAGAAYVPIDPEYPEERIRFMLKDTSAAIMVGSEEYGKKIAVTGSMDCIFLDSDWPAISNQPVTNVNAGIKNHHLAYVIYTSGSTGKPKGVMIEHGNLCSFIYWCRQEFSSSRFDTVYAGTSICFDLSVFEIFYPLSIGKRIRIIESGLYIGQYLPIDRDVLINTVPSVVQHLLTGGTDLRNISVMNMAGETIPLQVQQALDADRIAIRNLYGPTEDTTYSTVYRLKNGEPALIGRPVSNTQIYLVNQQMELLPVGVAGEICIAGTGVARGYMNRVELTAEKFIGNPFTDEPGARLYKTGDLGYWLPDGNLQYLGRIDEQVKIRGYRIELGEIEQVLQEMDAVKQAVVVAREDNNGARRLVGFVVPEGSIDRDAMQIYLQKKLPEYMVPALWVQLENIPLTSNGKINRNALPNPVAGDILSNAYEAPANEIEFQMAAIWKEILKLDRVGVNDNFFELGGHSLNAIQFAARLHKLLNIKIDIGAIFYHPTVRQLSKAMALEEKNQFVEINRLPEQDYYSLSHAQQRFWVLSHFKDGSEAYNVTSAFTIEGDLNMVVFRQAFDKVIERHEILRTIFVEIDGAPRQKILSLKASGFIIEEVDLQNKPGPEAFLKNWLEADARQAFDLSEGPLLRATIFREASHKFILVFTIHHIISDGWSKAIFIKEVLHYYKAFNTGVENNLSPLAIQYKDYAAWHSAAFEMQGQYWKSLYEKEIPVLNFPVDFERPAVLTFFGAMLKLRLTVSLTQDLRRKAIEHNMSLNNLLFAGYGLLVGRYSNQEEVVVGSLSSGRSHVDLENLIGVFINFLPVKLSPRKELSLSTYLDNSHQSLVNAYNNQDYPFDLMVDDCIRQRDISRNPFFDTMVNFHLENELAGKVDFGDGLLTGTGISIRPFRDLQEDLFQSVLDFKLDIEPVGDTLDLYLSYNSRLLLKETMYSFLDQYVELLIMIVNEPNKTLGDYGDRVKENPASGINEITRSSAPTPALPLNICASFVIEPVQEYVEYWSNEFELNIDVSLAPYNQVFQQLINPQSLLNTGKGINVLFIRIDDWLRDQAGIAPLEQAGFLNRNFLELVEAIKNIADSSFVPFMVGIVPLYASPSLSNEVIVLNDQLNNELEAFIKTMPRFHLLNLGKIARLYDVTEVYDAKSDELGHMPFTPEMYAALGTFLARKVNAFKGPGYKVIALDCDNTLWKGVCGELGALEVGIDENFKQLQEFVLQKYQEGFLLVICSKNNEADVWEVFDRHPGMKLKREHIAAHRINWEPKPGNLLSIAGDLNLGLNSFIFLDDSEFETEQMSIQCPEVLSINLPVEASEFKTFLDHIWAFDHFHVTDEDAKRNKMYQVEKQRKEEQVKYGSLAGFLESLDISVNINSITANEIERAVQLSLRTNQFNLNGIRKTPEEIAWFTRQENAIGWIIEVKDRFGDYGIVGVVLATVLNNILVIETFLLSCRVLGRNVEDHILGELDKYCDTHGIKTMTAQFQATIKNIPFRDFLHRTGWIAGTLTNTYSRLVKIDTKNTG
ncbi:MAG: amino acid adenylation domain-containing protein [Ferruginibacter sp.]|nr:amino acid adenylation domain-containing protein [Ferruginibacter sp.]